MQPVTRKLWEPPDDKRALLGLAGHSTRSDYEKNRKERCHELLEWCEIGSAKRGLEIGSGEGIVARQISRSCASLDCNDISETFLAKARVTCADCANVRFFHIDHYLDHLNENWYDFGYALNVFIHFNPYEIFNYLISVRRILKPNGRFYFDACTIGPQTLPILREHAAIYRQRPADLAALLNFNDAGMIRALAVESGLHVSDYSAFHPGGWLKVLLIKPQ